MASAGWLKGVVHEVVSGDTVVIAGTLKPGTSCPPLKRITLSSVIAPKLAKRDGTTRDEAFAWEAREFLRKLIIGQPVVFKVDYLVESIGNREFGSVFLGQQNVSEALVGAGLAKVRTGQQQSPYIESLQKAEESAKSAEIGVWSKNTSAAIREVPASDPASGFSAAAWMSSVGGKGTVIRGVVEQVANGGMMRVTTLPGHQLITVVVSGVQAPSMGRRAAAAAAAAAAPAADAVAVDASAPPPSSGPSAASIAASSAAEPYAVEAKHLTESRALSREIRLILDGTDKYDNLFATVFVPPANSSGTPPPTTEENLAELLLKEGLVKCVEWSLAQMVSGALRLRDLEKQAKAAKKALWVNYVPAPTTQGKLSDIFTGKVVEIVSGDCLVIKDNSTHVERRVNLSSLKAPRMGTRDRAPEPFATDAREFLRKKLIGREVEVKMEYSRKVPAAGELVITPGSEERVMNFGNVELVPEKGEEKQNVSEMVVARGFAGLVRHRTDEERSSVYEKLQECEELAKQAKRGIYSGKQPAANRMNDVSAPGNATKAKQHLPFLQRAGRMQGVVDFVLSGHRLKITVPKEGVCIVFAPSGIKTPAKAQPAQPGKPATQAEPFAEDAIAFTREHALQRDCEIVIETMDRGGTFLGTISILPASPGGRPLNLALALMKQGLARLQPNVDPYRLPEGSALLEAQQAAKQARLKIWQNWTPEMDKTAEDEEEEAAAAAAATPGGKQLEVLDVVVTEVVDANEFYVQRVKEPRVAWIAEQLRIMGEQPGPALPPELKAGQLCVAQYTADKQWYRAYVEKVHGTTGHYDVYFIDFGNREKVSERNVRAIEPTLAAVPSQAMMCRLAFVKVPLGAAEYAAEARGFLMELLSGGLPLQATVYAREKPGAKDNVKHPKWAAGHLVVKLSDPGNQADLAVELLCAGLARLPKLSKVRDPVAKDAITQLQPFEQEARQARRGMYVYGDVDSDEEDNAPKPGAWGKPK